MFIICHPMSRQARDIFTPIIFKPRHRGRTDVTDVEVVPVAFRIEESFALRFYP